MSKHTPGEWEFKRIHGSLPDSRTFGVFAKGHGWIVQPTSKTANPTVDQEHEANMHLTAAAPTMYDFIKSIAGDDDICTCSYHGWHGDGHCSQCVQEIAGAIIRGIQS